MLEHDANPRGDETLAPVQQILMEVLQEGGDDLAAALESRCRAHPEHADELRRRLRWLDSMGLLHGGRTKIADAPPERLGDFRILERLGGGGMGIVYRAHQESLGRDVALKLVRPEQLHFSDARERFRREVSSVARLNHPGIVPVYSVGEEHGLPFFAMELVRGATLGDALDALRGRDPATLGGRDFDLAIAAATGASADEASELAPLFAGSWEDTALRVVREVAEALEHAHRAGLVHRDIKPSNVMVTRGGRVMLVDFGLSSDERTDRLTRTGSQVGSLPYMPPEQLSGDRRADRRSDVYSLGVSLYELLSLRLPYSATNLAALASTVAEGRPPSIRRRNPKVSWETETVCLKAMEAEPERRYASAGDFARDLTNVLEHRPVFARRASAWRRTLRFCQRNPGTAAALVLGALLFVVAPAAWAWRERNTSRKLAEQSAELKKANLALEGSLAATQSEQVRAEANYADALGAVDRMLTRLADERLEHVPHVEALRRELYEDALEFYERLAERRADDPKLRRELARARIRMSALLSALGRNAELDLVLTEGIELLERAAAEAPEDEELQHELADALANASTIYGNLGRMDELEEAAGQSLAIYRELLARDPKARANRHGVANALQSIARAQRLTGRQREAVTTLHEALDVLAPDEPEAAYEPSNLRVILGEDLGRSLLELGQLDEAELALLDALALAEIHARNDPANPDLREIETDLLHPLANVAIARGDGEGALALWTRQLEVAEELERDFPGNHSLQEDVLRAVGNRGVALMYLKRFAEAEETFARAEELSEAIVASLPDEPSHPYDLAVTRMNLAEARMRQERFEEALAPLDAAIPALDEAALAMPGDHDAQRSPCNARGCRAETHLGLGRHAEAADDLRALRTCTATPALRLNAAILFGRCASRASEDESLASDARAALAEIYDQETLDALRWAVEGGFADRARLESVTSFDRIRARPEYAEVVASML